MHYLYILLLVGMISFPDFSGLSTPGTRKAEYRDGHMITGCANINKTSLQRGVLTFNAMITEKRNADNGTGDPIFLQQFDRVTINEGNIFNASSGTFQAPADGVYHFSGWFLIDDYQCWTEEFLRNPVSFDVTLVQNKISIIEIFKFPVNYNAYASSTGRPTATGQEFNLLLKLRAGDTIRLKVKSKKCDERKEAFFSKVIFSGFKVY